MSVRSERQIRQLQLAQECFELGARTRTIHWLTGLQPYELQRLFFTEERCVRRGRNPGSPEWYHCANLLKRVEASIVISVYRRLRSSGFAAAECLVAAYRHYQSLCLPPYRISFDRAFELVCHVDAIWTASTAALSLVTCASCGSEHLAAPGQITSTCEPCPFCRLLQRYPYDRRLQSSFPARPIHGAVALHPTITAIVHASDGPIRTGPDIHCNRPPIPREGSRPAFSIGFG